MRVLAFNWRDRTHPQAGGAEKNIHELGKRMVEGGHEFTLLCGMYEGAEEREIVDGFSVIRRGGNYSVYFAAPLHYLIRMRDYQPDVIIDDINGIPFFTPFFSKTPLVGLFHHRVGEIFKKELPFPICHIGTFIEDHLLPLMYMKNEMVTVSDSSKSELVDLGFPEENIHIVYNGVDTKFYTPSWGVKAEHPTICYLGRLKRYKRVDILLRTADHLRRDFPNLEVRIAGKGDDLERLKAITEELDLGDCVDFLGFITAEEKLNLLRRSWLFTMPSEKEGWGITSLEANACGTPVVAFNVPGLRDSVLHGKSGLLVENETGFIEAITSLFLDEELRSKLSKGAREWSLKYDWDVSAMKMINLLESVQGNCRDP